MRVLHLTRDFPPRCRGGMSTAVGGMVRASAAAGVEVAVVSFDDWRPARNVAVLSKGDPCAMDEATAVPCLRVTQLAQLGRVFDLARSFAPTIIHLHDAGLWTIARDLREEFGSPVIAMLHMLHGAMARIRGSDEPTRSRLGEERVLAGANLVIVPSTAAAAELNQQGADGGPPIRVIRHGIDDSDGARAAAKCSEREPILLYAGRFADMKGTTDLLTALPEVLRRVPAARCVLAGGVPGNRRTEVRWLRRNIEHVPTGVRERLSVPGWLDPDQLSSHYAAARVVIVPSRFETFGLVAVEAMLHGAAVVASDAGGLGELVRHGATGLQFPAGDTAALADAVVQLLENPTRARWLAKSAAVEVRQTHLWPQVISGLLTAYAAIRE